MQIQLIDRREPKHERTGRQTVRQDRKKTSVFDNFFLRHEVRATGFHSIVDCN